MRASPACGRGRAGKLWRTFQYFVTIPVLLRGRGRVFGLGRMPAPGHHVNQ